jgi:hypothetical protein
MMVKLSLSKWVLVAGLVLASLTAFALVAAQDADPMEKTLAAVTFKPISDIVDGDLTVTGFASDGSATLPVTTKVPVACSIVYGTTPDFGSLAVDMDMNGGTHSDHKPLLTGLEPETTYYYRVQGVDDAGVIYISDVMTFTTPAQQVATATNLASPELGATIAGYSSAFGNADPTMPWGALNAVDGSANTAWSSFGDGDGAWLEIKLAQKAHVSRVEYWSRTMTDGTSRVTAFSVTADDGTVYGPFTVPDADQAYSFDVDFETTSIRFEVVSSTGGNTGAVEFGVYGEFVDG